MPLKVSDQLVLSAQLYENRQGEQFRYALSGRTAQLVALDPASAQCLKDGQLPLDAACIERLRAAEILVQQQEAETVSIMQRNQSAAADKRSVTFTLLPSAHCNMACSYCGQTHSPGRMAKKVYRDMVMRVASAMAAAPTESVHVQWFGAEPMVAFVDILKMSRHLRRVAQHHGVHYSASMTTNGTLLSTEKIRQLHTQACVVEICVSLDGPQAVHDQRRPLKAGSRNFAAIAEVLQSVKADPLLAGLTVVLRTNIDRENSACVADYLRAMKRLGLDGPPFVFDLHAVYPWSNDVTAVELSKQEYARQEVHWLILMLELGLRFSNLPTQPHKVVCVAVQESAEVLDSSGLRYSCTEHPLVPSTHFKKSLGYFTPAWTGARAAKGEFGDFNAKISHGKLPCSTCPILGICGGACPKHWQEGHAPCPSFKHNIQARLDIAAIAAGHRIV